MFDCRCMNYKFSGKKEAGFLRVRVHSAVCSEGIRCLLLIFLMIFKTF